VGRALLKKPEKSFMIAGALLFAIASVVYLLVSPFWSFLILRIFHGVGFAFFHTASFTLIANISSEAHRGQSFSNFYLAFNIASTLAPPFGMFLINHFGFTHLFLACFGLSLCCLFISTKLGKRQMASLKNFPIEDGSLLSRKAVPSSIVGFFPLFIWGALVTFFPLYALNHGMSNPGLFFTANAIMIIVCRISGGKILNLYRERIIIPCFTTYIISMVIIAFSKTQTMFILAALIYGIGIAFLVPALLTVTLDRAGSSRGPVLGTFQAITDLGMCLGPVVMGIVVHATSYPIMFLCLALLGIIDVNYFYFFVRKKGG